MLTPDPRLSVAPMMALTDRHFRYLMRLITRQAVLYTEMVTAEAVIHGNRDNLLGHDPTEAPLVLQLGGSEPGAMAEAAAIGEAAGYHEVNINVGCPSDRVQHGRFGACLMAEPHTVAACVREMQLAVAIPVTVKCRIGIDRSDSDDLLFAFVEQVAAAGCRHFIVHARKAWLDGLNPRENRTIPPLRYPTVYRLKQKMPALTITINGGITDWTAVKAHLREVDGVMIGRQAYYHPASMLPADQILDGGLPDNHHVDTAPNLVTFDRLRLVASAYADYMKREQQRCGTPLSVMTRHLVALFQQVPGARLWRRTLSSDLRHYSDPVVLVEQALSMLKPPAGQPDSAAEPRH